MSSGLGPLQSTHHPEIKPINASSEAASGGEKTLRHKNLSRVGASARSDEHATEAVPRARAGTPLRLSELGEINGLAVNTNIEIFRAARFPESLQMSVSH